MIWWCPPVSRRCSWWWSVFWTISWIIGSRGNRYVWFFFWWLRRSIRYRRWIKCEQMVSAGILGVHTVYLLWSSTAIWKPRKERAGNTIIIPTIWITVCSFAGFPGIPLGAALSGRKIAAREFPSMESNHSQSARITERRGFYKSLSITKKFYQGGSSWINCIS